MSEVVVITGASAGVGRALAQAYGARGASVGLIARGLDGLAGAREDVERAGGRALVCAADVADADQVEQAAAAVERELGPIDIWINNALVSSTARSRRFVACCPEIAAASYRWDRRSPTAAFHCSRRTAPRNTRCKA